jgi:hypothetical protein
MIGVFGFELLGAKDKKGKIHHLSSEEIYL